MYLSSEFQVSFGYLEDSILLFCLIVLLKFILYVFEYIFSIVFQIHSESKNGFKTP